VNITFLIGNGFDLNLGLNTRYKDFTKVYKEYSQNDSRGITCLKDHIRNDKTSVLWSNAEIAFGKSTKQFRERGLNADDFCDSHDDFCNCLADYLSKEQKKIDFIKLKPQIARGFTTAIKNYTNGFREVEEQELTKTINTFAKGFTYNFINFNYTNTLNKCIEAVRSVKDILGTRRVSNYDYTNSIGKVIHVHGTITRSMVFGVNDTTQIEDSSIFNGYGEEFINSIIKQKANEINRENIDQKAFEILTSSDIIYVYGMSIGITDKLWWERICQLMKEKNNLHLIIHVFDAPKPRLSMRPVITFEKQKRKEFTSFVDLDEKEIENITKRIHIDSSNIFIELKDLALEIEKDIPKEPAMIS